MAWRWFHRRDLDIGRVGAVRADTAGPVGVSTRGAVVSGRLATEDLNRAISYAVASLALEEWQRRLDERLVKPTPFYETRIRLVETRHRWTVTDQGVIYGAWLEGTGSRNYPVTRFRGYRSARDAAAATQARAPELARWVAAAWLEGRS